MYIERKFANKTYQLKPICSENVVINLSSKSLTEDEITLLSKGLTFCPTPGEPDFGQIWTDLKSFFRKLRLKQHFAQDKNESFSSNANFSTQDTQSDEYDDRTDHDKEIDKKFKASSNWEPKGDQTLETFIQAVTNDFGKMSPMRPRHSNLTDSESKSLKALKEDQSIVIKKADKGSAVVVMDGPDYVREAERQLSDQNFYLSTTHDKTAEFSVEISKILTDLLELEEISWENHLSLNPVKPRTAQFYFLPKVHKPNITGRPIVSGNGCPTEQISAFVDEHIKRYVPLLPSYVRDTTDFIKKIESIVLPEQCLLATMDVTSLYTNIPNHEGKTAIHRTLVEHNYRDRLSKKGLLLLLETVLHKNNFDFNGKHYHQIGGTAMGTKLAPSYACLFMGVLEKALLKKYRREHPLKPVPSTYLRFIDDIFMVFPGSKHDFDCFINFANTFHPTIKFTTECSNTDVVFLDTRVIRKGQSLYTTLYTKETDTHSYLHYDSSHPRHTKEHGPYGQFLRLKRNCPQPEDFKTNADKMEIDYKKRGYPDKIVRTERRKAETVERKTILHPTVLRTKKERVPLVIPFNPMNPPVMTSILKHWDILKIDPDNAEIFKEKPLLAHRRCPNLRDKLVRAALPDKEKDKGINPNRIRQMNHCTHKNCPLRRNFLRTDNFKSHTTKRTYKKWHVGNCTTKNVVYMLTCTLCGKQYVGQTKRELKVRIGEHLYNIKKHHDTPVAQHFNHTNHSADNLRCEIIEALKTDPEDSDSRLSRETHWIHQLQTLHPNGMNVRD